MIKLNDKKGFSLVWTMIILGLIGMVVAILVIVFSREGLGKGFGFVNERIGALEDFDDDGISNMFDKCPCRDFGTVEDDDLQGCPSGTTSEEAKDERDKFNEEKCDEFIVEAGDLVASGDPFAGAEAAGEIS